MNIDGLGPLAGALAKAQAAFPPIPRDVKVEVTTRTGGKYSFNYAPLESILSAVREPLSSNALAIAQLLDGPDLVTVLLHESGATLTARTPLPHQDGDTVQQYGSAVTYVRRYALQAMLGIASEDDDDGNAAAGNTVKPKGRARTEGGGRVPEERDHGGMDGFASIGNADADMQLRMTPTGHALSFRLTETLGGRKGFKVTAVNSLAEKLAAVRDRLIDQRVRAWGTFTEATFPKQKPDGSVEMIGYRILHLQRIETPAGLFVAAKDDLEPALAASLEEHVRNRVAAAPDNLSQPRATQPDPDEDDEVTQAMGVRRMQAAKAEPDLGLG